MVFQKSSVFGEFLEITRLATDENNLVALLGSTCIRYFMRVGLEWGQTGRIDTAMHDVTNGVTKL